MNEVIEPTVESDFTFGRDKSFELSGGGQLQPVTLRYTLYGQLNEARDNALLVCHALSGSARVAEWWPQLIGPGKSLDTNRYCVIGVNVLGSCYGSTGPSSLNPQTGEPYACDFPLITIGDMVRAQVHLLDHLGISRLYAVIGGSIGGMQALSWAVDFPEKVARCIAIGAVPLSAMGLALNHLQRQAIRSDPAWLQGRYPADRPPVDGLALARAIAQCTYKSSALFNERFARRPDRSGEDPHRSMVGRYDIAGYLDYQGSNFTTRFDANSYLVISKAMDTFEIDRSYGSEDEALKRIKARLLLVGISSDWLFTPAEIQSLASRARAVGADVEYSEIDSSHGHDGFLADAEFLGPIVRAHLEERRYAKAASSGGYTVDSSRRSNLVGPFVDEARIQL